MIQILIIYFVSFAMSAAVDHFSHVNDSLFLLQVGTDIKKGKSNTTHNTSVDAGGTIPDDGSGMIHNPFFALNNPNYYVFSTGGPLGAKTVRHVYKNRTYVEVSELRGWKSHNIFFWSAVYAAFAGLICCIIGVVVAGDQDQSYLVALFWMFVFIWSTGTLVLVGKSAMAADAFAFPLEFIFLKRLTTSIVLLTAFVWKPNIYPRCEKTVLKHKMTSILWHIF